MKKGIAICLAGMLLASLMPSAHARQTRMQDLQRWALKPIGATPLNAAIVESAIRDGAKRSDWSVVAQVPGELVLERLIGQHRMEVAVKFDDSGFDIDYRASDVLNYEIKRGIPYIHPNYNEWVFELANSIAKSTALDGSRPAGPMQAIQITPSNRFAMMAPLPINRRLKIREGYHVSADIQRCPFFTAYNQEVASQSSQRVVLTDKPTESLPGYSLETTLMNVHSIGGGSVTGPKFAVVEINLYQDGKLIGNVRKRRNTFKGMTGCNSLERIGLVLARDTMDWLRAGQFEVHNYPSYDDAEDSNGEGDADADVDDTAESQPATEPSAAPVVSGAEAGK